MFLSICIPNYNYAKYVSRAIKSALSSQSMDYEVIVSDNCSTDGSWETISQINDPRLRVFRQDKNIGMYPNWQALLEQAKGRYFKILPSDDWVSDGYVDTLIKELQAGESLDPDFIIHGIENVMIRNEAKPSISMPLSRGLDGYVKDYTFDLMQIMLRYSFHDYFIVKTDLAKLSSGYTIDEMRSDYLFMARCLLKSTCGALFLNKVLAGQLVHGSNDRGKYTFDRAIRDEYRCWKLFSEAGYGKQSLFWYYKIISQLSAYRYTSMVRGRIGMYKKYKGLSNEIGGRFLGAIFMPFWFATHSYIKLGLGSQTKMYKNTYDFMYR